MKTQMDDIMQNVVAFDPAQLHAIKTVERAMKVAAKLGVSFWDDYGVMTAYNANVITLPSPTSDGEYKYSGGETVYSCIKPVRVTNFRAGNADDPLSFNTI